MTSADIRGEGVEGCIFQQLLPKVPDDNENEEAAQWELGETPLRVPAHLARLQDTAVHSLHISNSIITVYRTSFKFISTNL